MAAFEVTIEGAIVEAAPDAKVVVDENGQIVLVNEQTERLFGYERRELIGKPVEVLLPQRLAARHREHRAAFSVSPGVRTMCSQSDLCGLRKDGTEFPVEIALSPVQTSEGILVIAAIRDISERRSLEKQLQEKERLATLGTTAAVFAHEIANPLNGISTALEMMNEVISDWSSSPSELQRYVEVASAEIERVTTLVNEYRSFARPNHLNLEPTDVQKLLNGIVSLHYRDLKSKGITIELEIPHGLPSVMLDRGKITQAILNLCHNAIDAMPNGGTLIVRVIVQELILVIEVEDTGTGIAEGVDVFQLFKTTKAGGTGLGLPTVQQIVSDHKGVVRYVSESGKGTTFKIALPLNPS